MAELPEPRANPDLLGHAGAEGALDAALHSPRMHHAWLLLGPTGVGKATLAFRFARRLLAGPAEGAGLFLAPEHPVFRRVAAAAHADLLTVERAFDEKRNRRRGEIVADDVRRVTAFMHRTPAEGGWRVVVIDGAEDLNRNAANALLKVLEEPPPRAVLLLVCAAIGRLPATVRSRCRRLGLGLLADGDIATLLARARPDLASSERDRLVALAGGSIGRALQLAEGGAIAVADLVARTLREPARLDGYEALLTADALGRDEDAFGTFMDLLRGALAGAVRAAAAGAASGEQARMLGGRALDRWVAIWQSLGQLQSETEGLHLDKRAALVQGFRLLSGDALPP